MKSNYLRSKKRLQQRLRTQQRECLIQSGKTLRLQPPSKSKPKHTIKEWLSYTLLTICYAMSVVGCSFVQPVVKTPGELPLAPPQTLLQEPPKPGQFASYQEALRSFLLLPQETQTK